MRPTVPPDKRTSGISRRSRSSGEFDSRSRWDRVSPLALAAMALLVFTSAASWPRGIVTDTFSVDASAWRLAKYGSLNLAGVAGGVPWLVHVSPGVAYSDRFPGAILAGVPAYLLGPNQLTEWPGTLTAVILGVVSVVLLQRLVTNLAGPFAGRVAATVAVVASPVLSLVSDQLWAHSVTVPSILAAMVLAQRACDRRSTWMLLWSAVALVPGILARPHVAVVSLCLGVGFALLWRRILPLLVVGIPATASMAGILIYHHVLFAGSSTSGDGLLVGSYTGRTGHLIATLGAALFTNIAGGLLSINRGVFIYAPWTLIAIFALRPAWRSAPPWVRMFAASAPLYALIQLAGNGYSGGSGFFGLRVLVEPVSLLAPLAVVAWPISQSWLRRLLLVLFPAYVLLYVVGSFYSYPSEPVRFWASWTPADLVWMAPWTVWLIGAMAAILAATTTWPSLKTWSAREVGQTAGRMTAQPPSSA